MHFHLTAPLTHANLLFILQNQAEVIKTITSLKVSLNPSGRSNPFLPPPPLVHLPMLLS